MTRPEIWISITCTDRAASLRALTMDLAAQATQANAEVCLLINDNSTQAGERSANRALAPVLRAAGVAVVLDGAPQPGASIAASRRRQRAQIRDRLAARSRPTFVWMLDDDVQLRHLRWTGEWLDERPLHCHLAFLLELARSCPELDVLVGEVCGDPPIPVLGSIASRLSDLEASMQVMFESPPDTPWRPPTAALERLTEDDAYYDLSIARPLRAWEREILWLPRGARLSTAEALRQMLAEVEHVPRGAAFSRPILARPERFAELVEWPLRGANAVFFDVERCVQHEYPCVEVAGIKTRRGDMIGTSLLAGAGATIRGSGFSVLHHRPRDARWPAAEELTAGLISDTIGAWLARRLGSQSAEDGRSFIEARLARLQATAGTLAGICARLRHLVDRAPTWAPPLGAVEAVAGWAVTTFPGARDRTLPRELIDTLAAAARDDLVATARHAAEGGAA